MDRQVAKAASVHRRESRRVSPHKEERRRASDPSERLTVYTSSDFERFIWAVFDRVEKKDGVLLLANGDRLVFHLPVEKLEEPRIQQAIFDFVIGGHRLDTRPEMAT